MGKYDALFYNDAIDSSSVVPVKKSVGKYSALFDDEPSETTKVDISIPKSDNKGYLENLFGYFTEDIPSAVKDTWTGMNRRAANIEAPTELGQLAKKATGSDIAENLAAVPERIVRTVGEAGGSLGDITGQLIALAAKSGNRLTGGKAGELLAPAGEKAVEAIKKVSESDLGKTLIQLVNDLTPAEKANYSATLGLTELLGYGPAKKATKVAKKAVDNVATKTSKSASGIVDDIGKAVNNQAGMVAFNASNDIPDIMRGAGVVDDIEEIVSVSPVQGQTIRPKTFKEIEKATKPAFKPVKKFGVIPSGMDDIEAFALAAPEQPGTVPFTAYAEKSIIAKPRIDAGGNPVPTALDAVGTREIEAMQRLDKVVSDVGKAKSDLIEKASSTATMAPWGETVGLVDTTPIKIAMENEVSGILGATVGTGRMKSMPGRIASEVSREAIDDMASIVNRLPNAATATQVDDAIKRLYEIKKSMEGGVSTRYANSPTSQRVVVEKVRDIAKDALDDHIVNMLSPEDGAIYRNLNRSYANLVKNRDYAQRRIGALVGDIDDQQLARGAGVARAAVANNSDMGTKAMFDFLKKYTGIDLYREALYAWLATKAAGDTRGIDLIEGAIKGGSVLKGTPMSISGAGTAAMELVKGNKMKTLIDYYNKMQGNTKQKTLLDIVSDVNNKLGQRGSIGTGEGLSGLYESPLGALTRASAGSVAGGTAGYASGDTPEERRNRAIAGMLIGATGGAMASKGAIKGLGSALK